MRGPEVLPHCQFNSAASIFGQSVIGNQLSVHALEHTSDEDTRVDVVPTIGRAALALGILEPVWNRGEGWVNFIEAVFLVKPKIRKRVWC